MINQLEYKILDNGKLRFQKSDVDFINTYHVTNNLSQLVTKKMLEKEGKFYSVTKKGQLASKYFYLKTKNQEIGCFITELNTQKKSLQFYDQSHKTCQEIDHKIEEIKNYQTKINEKMTKIETQIIVDKTNNYFKAIDKVLNECDILIR